jgi:hypothetical protein
VPAADEEVESVVAHGMDALERRFA